MGNGSSADSKKSDRKHDADELSENVHFHNPQLQEGVYRISLQKSSFKAHKPLRDNDSPAPPDHEYTNDSSSSSEDDARAATERNGQHYNDDEIETVESPGSSSSEDNGITESSFDRANQTLRRSKAFPRSYKSLRDAASVRSAAVSKLDGAGQDRETASSASAPSDLPKDGGGDASVHACQESHLDGSSEAAPDERSVALSSDGTNDTNHSDADEIKKCARLDAQSLLGEGTRVRRGAQDAVTPKQNSALMRSKFTNANGRRAGQKGTTEVTPQTEVRKLLDIAAKEEELMWMRQIEEQRKRYLEQQWHLKRSQQRMWQFEQEQERRMKLRQEQQIQQQLQLEKEWQLQREQQLLSQLEQQRIMQQEQQLQVELEQQKNLRLRHELQLQEDRLTTQLQKVIAKQKQLEAKESMMQAQARKHKQYTSQKKPKFTLTQEEVDAKAEVKKQIEILVAEQKSLTLERQMYLDSKKKLLLQTEQEKKLQLKRFHELQAKQLELQSEKERYMQANQQAQMQQDLQWQLEQQEKQQNQQRAMLQQRYNPQPKMHEEQFIRNVQQMPHLPLHPRRGSETSQLLNKKQAQQEQQQQQQQQQSLQPNLQLQQPVTATPQNTVRPNQLYGAVPPKTSQIAPYMSLPTIINFDYANPPQEKSLTVGSLAADHTFSTVSTGGLKSASSLSSTSLYGKTAPMSVRACGETFNTNNEVHCQQSTVGSTKGSFFRRSNNPGNAAQFVKNTLSHNGIVQSIDGTQTAPAMAILSVSKVAAVPQEGHGPAISEELGTRGHQTLPRTGSRGFFRSISGHDAAGVFTQSYSSSALPPNHMETGGPHVEGVLSATAAKPAMPIEEVKSVSEQSARGEKKITTRSNAAHTLPSLVKSNSSRAIDPMISADASDREQSCLSSPEPHCAQSVIVSSNNDGSRLSEQVTKGTERLLAKVVNMNQSITNIHENV